MNVQIRQNHFINLIYRLAQTLFQTGWKGIEALLLIVFLGILAVDAIGLLVLVGYTALSAYK